MHFVALWLACTTKPVPPPAPAPEPPVPTTPEVAPAPEPPPTVEIAIDRLPADHDHGGTARPADDIDMVVIHTVGGQFCGDGELKRSPAGRDAVYWRDWFETQGGKSIHYIVGREGDIAQQRPELRTAGHVAFQGVMAGVNGRSVGIELVNRGDGEDPFPEAQLAALDALVGQMAIRYGLDADDLYTHAELDTRMLEPPCEEHRRNVDPGPSFPMDRLRDAVTATTER